MTLEGGHNLLDSLNVLLYLVTKCLAASLFIIASFVAENLFEKIACHKSAQTRYNILAEAEKL